MPSTAWPSRPGQFLGPLQEIALASLNTLGNLMFMIFLSLFIVIDKDRLLGFVNQVTPPRFAEEMRLFQTSVASSFGGFIRGQGIQGLVYGAVAAAGSIALGIDFVPLTTALVAIFQMIPFFGPFVSWAPPVVAAILTQPDAIIPIIAIMAVGWFVTMNIVQPRVMASSVGIHPIVVLVSVLIGLRLQGVVGAIFAIPVAAVISAFFFHYLNRSKGGPRDVTSRAARRLEARQGRPVRVPAPPPVTAPGGVSLATAPAAAVASGAGVAGGSDHQVDHGVPGGAPIPGCRTLRRREQRRGAPGRPPVTAGRHRPRGRGRPCAGRRTARGRGRRRCPDRQPGRTHATRVRRTLPGLRSLVRPRHTAHRPAAGTNGRRDRASWSPTTTASSRAGCSCSSRPSSPSATSTSWRRRRTSRPWATR